MVPSVAVVILDEGTADLPVWQHVTLSQSNRADRLQDHVGPSGHIVTGEGGRLLVRRAGVLANAIIMRARVTPLDRGWLLVAWTEPSRSFKVPAAIQVFPLVLCVGVVAGFSVMLAAGLVVAFCLFVCAARHIWDRVERDKLIAALVESCGGHVQTCICLWRDGSQAG